MLSTAVFGLLGCSGTVDLSDLIEPGTISALVVVEHDTGMRLEALARDVGPGLRLEAREEGDLSITALLYPWSLEDLNLQAGPLAIEEGGVLLPEAAVAYHSQVSGHSAQAWSKLDAVPAQIRALHVKGTSTLDCLLGGGCLVDRVPGHAGSCTRPCPEPSPPEPPAPPEPPNFLPCPDGWREIQADGVTVCDPYPASGRAACTIGEHHFLGTSGCAPLGDVCPTTGRYALNLPSGRPVLYADPNAPAGGDGSLAAPFSTLAAALAAATPGSLIALSIGTFQESLAFPADDVGVMGACTALTRIEPIASATVAECHRLGAALSNVNLAGGNRSVLVRGGALTLRGVLITAGPFGPAVRVEQGRLLAERVQVIGGQAGISGVGSPGLVLRTLALSDHPYSNIELEGSDALVEDAELRNSTGAGILALGSSVTAHRILVEDNYQGLSFERAQSSVVSDVIVRRLRFAGVIAKLGANADIQRMRLEFAQEVAVNVNEGSPTLTLSDALIRDISGGSTGRYGFGLEAYQHSTLSARRVVVERASVAGVQALDPGAEIRLEDVEIRHTRPRGFDSDQGMGMNITNDGAVDATRVIVDRSHSYGIWLAQGRLNAQDLIVRNTLPRLSDGGSGRGIHALLGSKVDVQRVELLRNHSLGVLAQDPETQVDLSDFRITGTSTSICSGLECNEGISDGFSLGLNAGAKLSHFAIVDNGVYGVRLVNNSQLEMHDGRISGHQIGLQVTGEGYPLEELAKGVLIENNDMSIVVGAD